MTHNIRINEFSASRAHIGAKISTRNFCRARLGAVFLFMTPCGNAHGEHMGAPICPLSGNSALTIRQVLPAALLPEIEHICIAREPSVPVPARQREERSGKREKRREGTQRKAEKGVISRQGRESSGLEDRGQGRKNIMPCGERGRQGRKKGEEKNDEIGSCRDSYRKTL